MENLNLSDKTLQVIEEVADRKNVTFQKAIEDILENQSGRELLRLKEVEMAVKNIKRNNGYER